MAVLTPEAPTGYQPEPMPAQPREAGSLKRTIVHALQRAAEAWSRSGQRYTPKGSTSVERDLRQK